MDMVTALWPKPDNKKKQEFVRSAMTKLNEVGLVGIHDAGVTPGNLELYKTLSRSDYFTVRVYASKGIPLPPPLPGLIRCLLFKSLDIVSEEEV